jgi:hypothetical protein
MAVLMASIFSLMGSFLYSVIVFSESSKTIAQRVVNN